MTATKHPGGRPSGYSPERVEPFLNLIAEAKSTVEAAKAIGVEPRTIFRWLETHDEFRQQYARAKEAAADHLVEEVLAIVDDGRNDFIEGKGGPIFNAEAVARSRLRFEARKWLAGKLRPKKYGEKLDVDHGVQPESSLAVFIKSISGSSIKPVEKAGREEEHS
ncbi:terminase small subunit protein [Enterovirga rhinocerotis]|uniref:Terminase small subunit n=1 Tax=Enterovirga rhinocerotis TaxID=1339210 RepID=A0A4R7C1J4_9HYPH|nr:terminase small subunit protein [Enterovirga rhinocerotis]TDR90256.1 hypothetical protein EV668_3098 [Enterovirga rhinocerotis]